MPGPLVWPAACSKARRSASPPKSRASSMTAKIMHVLPIVTRGPTENVNDLLYLKGVDAGDHQQRHARGVQIASAAISSSASAISSICFRPNCTSSFGRKFARSRTSRARRSTSIRKAPRRPISGPLIFSRLGIDVDKMFIPHPVALEQMKRGEVSAVVFMTSKPIDAFLKGRWDAGIQIPAGRATTRRFEDYYLPTSLNATDYPNLIARANGWKPSRCRPFWSRTTGATTPTGTSALHALVDDLFNRIDKLQDARIRCQMERHQSERESSRPGAISGSPGVDRPVEDCETK